MTEWSISDLIPHGPGMCLIDRIVEHDAGRIHCATGSHRRDDNPLSEHGRLSSLAVIEYASQAAAIHAALSGSGFAGGRVAYIGMVKSVNLFRETLSDIDADIHLKAECVLSQDRGAVYRFEAYGDSPIADGQLNLVIPGDD